jgi:hypothetical protein
MSNLNNVSEENNVSNSVFAASNCSVLHLDAGHDQSGNPMRLYLIVCGSEVVAALDEGYNGVGILNKWGRPVGKVLMNNISIEIKITKREYKSLLKITSRTVALSVHSEIELSQIEALKENGRAIRYIRNPSEEMQLAAVTADGLAIEWIEGPSEAVQLAAVKNNSYALQYIKNPSEQVKLEAVKECGESIQYIKNPSEEIKLAAVKQYGYAIYHINDPSEAVQLAAVNDCPSSIIYIKNPTEAVKSIAKKMVDI